MQTELDGAARGTTPADDIGAAGHGDRPGSRWRRLRWLANLRGRMTLQHGTDVEQTVSRISGSIALRGEAPWMLVCSCLLASIGLDVNSTAVIIGAMLISPLMSPILGVGLATAQVDRPLLFESAKELALATVVALLTSALYFRLSPLGEPTPELLARTTPTLLDVGVAFFGGVAGIVAGSRKQTSLALPGVAIATALMPPLCTAGFGLATGRWAFLFGALYLYILNAIFIALATFLVARLLHFPLHTARTGDAIKRERRLIGAIAATAVLPSLWFLLTIVQNQRENRRVDRFLKEEITARGHDLLRFDRDRIGDSTVLKVFIAGPPLTSTEMDSVRLRLAAYALTGYRVVPVQSDVTRNDLTTVRTEIQSDVVRLLTAAQAARDSATRRRDSLSVLRGSRLDTASIRSLGAEISSVFPEVLNYYWAPLGSGAATDSLLTRPTLLITVGPRVGRRESIALIARIERLARIRLRSDRVRVEAR